MESEQSISLVNAAAPYVEDTRFGSVSLTRDAGVRIWYLHCMEHNEL
jgi:hypothetical protein